MSPRLYLSFCVLAFSLTGLSQEEAAKETVDSGASAAKALRKLPRLDAKDKETLREHLGRKAIVTGLIKTTKDWDGGANFLNFDGRECMLVCFESEYANFPDGKPAKTYRGKHIEVTGYINEYKGKLQIKLTNPGQIKVVEPAAEKKAPETQKKDETPKAEEKEKSKLKKVDPKKYFC